MFERAEATAPETLPAPAVEVKSKKKKAEDDAFSVAYRSFCYRLLGERFDRGPTNSLPPSG